eukprot:CAMPEP_0113694022 /NCGR_PEP_ID=MMETSP0038_2-20120614/20022_1 /TAXON_ID=2898 /ORGANISM="Cryptomonas paramecium" /LENGTH=317 /DNA_ID=CAMNT_0000616225 /DNA_START=261 /DNA_END=1212 /DNA_ORIENTATION=- /assembly_acc=CAM_ASM_000170
MTDMKALVDAGFITFDLADHYGPAEDFVGAFREQYLSSLPMDVAFLTKWVPRPGPMPLSVVDAALKTSQRRMKTETLDMVQFHWWDYADASYLDMLRNAQVLAARSPRPALRSVSLTNFDTPTIRKIVEAGVDVVSNQCSYSVVDTRPADQMAAYCQARGIALLCYGSLLGGLLSDRWLGKPEPTAAQLDTASLGKYARFVRSWGGWGLFQEMLQTLSGIARKHGVTIANVAVRWVLQQPAVAAVIVGMRLGHTAAAHVEENRRVFGFALDAEDLAVIAAVQARARRVHPGEPGDEYRYEAPSKDRVPPPPPPRFNG